MRILLVAAILFQGLSCAQNPAAQRDQPTPAPVNTASLYLRTHYPWLVPMTPPSPFVLRSADRSGCVVTAIVPLAEGTGVLVVTTDPAGQSVIEAHLQIPLAPEPNAKVLEAIRAEDRKPPRVLPPMQGSR